MSPKLVEIAMLIHADAAADNGPNCPMEHKLDTSGFAAFMLEGDAGAVALNFTAASLRAFLELGIQALAEMDEGRACGPGVVPRPSSKVGATNGASHLLSGDEDWLADKVLLTTVTPVIAQLSAYVVRYFDADAGHGEPVSVGTERSLADSVTELGAALHKRADRREASGELLSTVEGGTTQPRALEPSHG